MVTEDPRERQRRVNRRLVEDLADLWDEFPDQRFGQFVMNLSREPGGFADTWEWSIDTWGSRILDEWRKLDSNQQPSGTVTPQE